MLGACASSDNKVLTRELPAAPEFVKPIDVPQVRAGDNALIVAAQMKKNLVLANDRLIATGNWYEALRQSYRENK